jgi:hypothetical protein
MLGRIFVPKREEVTAGRRKLDDEDAHNLCPSLTFRAIKSTSMRWTGHVEHIGR